MKTSKNQELWFVTGSQHLYGEEALKTVTGNAKEICMALDQDKQIPVTMVFKPILTRPEEIYALCMEANANEHCIGLVTWMHTFSPAKMWINGIKPLAKPVLHLHTQYNQEIPWDQIDMDFMNLNQSAHGGREYGFLLSRMGISRKVVVGHWSDPGVIQEIGTWARAARAFTEWQNMKVARFGDNMREVAVTEGNKVSAQMQFGFDVYGYGVGDLVERVKAVTENSVNQLVQEYKETYHLPSQETSFTEGVKKAARVELGMRDFLEEGNFKAFTTTFEDLHGLPQLPGLAVQRLMADGYGFGAEGDWKTAALVRAMKVMAKGLEGGTSFMEDYTYHLQPGKMQVLGAHMLEVCPSITTEKPRLEVHPLSIGGKEDPARLVFKTKTGPALNAALMDMGNRYRLLVNPVQVVECPDLPKLPVASVLWEPEPDLKRSAEAWILAGGAHHTGFSQALTAEYLEIFAEMTGIEFLLIDNDTRMKDFKKEIRNNELYYLLKK